MKGKPVRARIITGAVAAIVIAPTMHVATASAADACTATSQFGGGFKTNLGSGWTSLARRSGPCTAANSTSSYGEGAVWTVTRETHGQFICRGKHTYNYGTDVWFKNWKNEWSWSGGTADARWNYKKAC